MSSMSFVITYPDGRSEDRVLGPARYEIGRDAGDIVLGSTNVSARHAALEVQAEAAIITDLGSTNGTFDPDGNRLSAPHVLVPGQAVRIGDCRLSVKPPLPLRGGTSVMTQMPEPVVAPAVALPAERAVAAKAPEREPAVFTVEGKPYVFAKLGVVHGARTWSETYVSGGGGGGFVQQGSGYVNPVRVQSTVSEKERFFVRHPDGSDATVTLSDAGDSFANGQEVVLIYGSRTDPDQGLLYAIYNRRTQRLTYPSGAIQSIAPKYPRWCVAVGSLIVLVCALTAEGGKAFAGKSFDAGSFWHWVQVGISGSLLSLPLLASALLFHYLPLMLKLKAKAREALERYGIRA